jgi:hypothetical protein
MTNWLLWAPLVAAAAHIVEEFVFPGGFPSWYRRYRANASRVTPRFLILINAGLLVTCAEIAVIARQPAGAAVWLAMAAILASNGCWHVWASFRSRTYAPGTVTGALLYVPMALYGYVDCLRHGVVAPGVAVVALVVGGSYQFWSSAYHKGSTKRGETAPGD